MHSLLCLQQTGSSPSSPSSPRSPRSNGQAEAVIKTVKELLTHTKCSGQDQYLALLAYCSMPINTHLHSPAEMLFQWVLCTTVPQWIMHTNPHANAECDHINQHAAQSTEYHNQWGCHKNPPFFASQNISVHNDARNLWLPTTIICKANNGSYLVQVIGDGQYRHAHYHIWECHLDAVKPGTSNIGNVAPAASTTAHATQAVGLPTAVAPTTQTPAAPAATMWTPCKALPAVCHHDKHRCHPLEPPESDWHSPCSPMLINLKQEATIQASWRNIDPDCPLQINLMTSWPRMPLEQLLKCCTHN